MSKFEDGSYGSLTGIALIGKVLAGRCQMHYGTIPEGLTPKTMTGPAGYVMDAQIAAVSNPVDGECQVTVRIKSESVESGFYLTNIVLFAEDPDDGEVPYTYLCLENEPEWIRPASSVVGKLATFDLIAAVGDVDTVTAVIDPENRMGYWGVRGSRGRLLRGHPARQRDRGTDSDCQCPAEAACDGKEVRSVPCVPHSLRWNPSLCGKSPGERNHSDGGSYERA